MVSQGRPFQPTQSLPAIPSSSGIFLSDRDAQAQARLIVKDDLRLRELQPYSSTSTNALNLSPRAQAAQLDIDDDLRLRFDANGEVIQERRRGHKRRDADDEGGDTDTDSPTGVNHALPPPGSAPPPQAAVGVADDFPPVFKSPQLSIPELYGPQSMAPPPVPNRAFAGMPRRQLRPTMSAPVGRLGSEQGGLRGFGMQVDDEDGFDVGDWAAEQEGGADIAGWTKNDQF